MEMLLERCVGLRHVLLTHPPYHHCAYSRHPRTNSALPPRRHGQSVGRPCTCNSSSLRPLAPPIDSLPSPRPTRNDQGSRTQTPWEVGCEGEWEG